MPDKQPFTVTIDETRRYPPFGGAAFGHFEERVARDGLSDPFHTTVVQPRGWRSAWAVLRGRYCARVRIDAPAQVVARVMEAIKTAEIDQESGGGAVPGMTTLHANKYSPLGRIQRDDGTLDIDRLREQEGQ